MTKPKHKRPPAAVSRDTYAMAMPDGENAEITMYGEIMETRPINYWTGEPVEGEFILQDEFLNDLQTLAGAQSITIRMNSVGGNAGVSILIHNRLRELAAAGTKLICIVDGVAMSGGSLIMCACDEVRVNPSSLIMIHKCWCFLFGGYNANELRETAAGFDAWDKAQVSIYKRKCGLSDTAIANMMAKTTYMSGAEAVEKGFADTLLEDAEPLDIAASADGRSIFVRGRQLHLTPGMFAPDTIPTKPPEASEHTKGGQKTMAETLEELKAENPSLAERLMREALAAVQAQQSSGSASADAVGEAVRAEQKRLQEIDAVAPLFDDETVNAAKYGEHACTAQEMTYRAAQKAAKQGGEFLKALKADADASGAQDVGAAPGGEADDGPKTPEQRMAEARAEVKSLLSEKEGR